MSEIIKEIMEFEKFLFIAAFPLAALLGAAVGYLGMHVTLMVTLYPIHSQGVYWCCIGASIIFAIFGALIGVDAVYVELRKRYPDEICGAPLLRYPDEIQSEESVRPIREGNYRATGTWYTSLVVEGAREKLIKRERALFVEWELPRIKQRAEDLGFNVEIADTVSDDDKILSSTSIRNLLADGCTRDAAKMLGHWHRLDGLVITGDQRGRTLGYPTANISLDRLHKPRLGIYSVLVDILSGPECGSYTGVTSVGKKPMFGDNVINCETYIFDFQEDIYGEEISVALIDFIRPEENFSSVEELILQMDLDCRKAKKSLSRR